MEIMYILVHLCEGSGTNVETVPMLTLSNVNLEVHVRTWVPSLEN